MFWLVTADCEILNGGIRQLFWNHSNWEIRKILVALKMIGAAETAQQIQEAIHVFETSDIPATRYEYWFEDKDFHANPVLNAIDDARCNQEASDRDFSLLVAYMRRYPEHFLHG